MPQKQEVPQKPKNIMDFGVEFQQQLIAEILTNHKFGLEIVDIIDSGYFKNQYFGYLVKLIKDYHKKHEVILSFDGLKIEIDVNYSGFVPIHKTLLDTLEGVKQGKILNKNVSDIALKFCKFESVRTTIDSVKKKLDGGYYEDYDSIENSIRKAITFKEVDEGINIHAGVESALEDDYREPIETGISGIDDITNGGLGKGELAVVIAPLGVGKTTFLSIIGSNAYKKNKNVLHIFFEDKINEVRRKYLSHWSDVPLPILNSKRDLVLASAKKLEEELPDANLILVKLKADTTDIHKLKRVIKHENNKLGGKLDMIIIDYADCIKGDQGKDVEEWSGEGRTMRQLEGIAEEFNVALWTAVQGGRRSTTAAVVEVDMIGGNIKKAQVGHLIISIAKTLTQRDQKLATIAILKSRFGDDGKVFEDCTFDNSRMLIDTTTEESFNAFSENQKTREVTRVREVVKQLRQEQSDANKAQMPVNNEFNKP